MKQKKSLIWAVMIGTAVVGLTACGIDMPKETKTSFETMTVQKQDITVPLKFSAKLKGQSDVTITPQVSGQLVKIAVSEGQQVKKGQVLFVIDQRNAQLELVPRRRLLEQTYTLLKLRLGAGFTMNV